MVYTCTCTCTCTCIYPDKNDAYMLLASCSQILTC